MNPSAADFGSTPRSVVSTYSDPDPILTRAIDDLWCGDFQARWDATKVIQTYGERAIAPILAAIRDDALAADDEPDEELLWFLARLFGDWRGAEAIAALTDLLATTSDDDAIAMVAAALAKQGEAAIAPLTDMLTQPARRFAAYRALACIPHPDVLPLLRAAATDLDATIREIALEALGRWRDRDAARFLLVALSDPVAAVRRVAIEGMSTQLTLERNPNTLEAWLETISHCLDDLDLQVAEKAAFALSRSPSPRAIELLGAHLQTERVPVRLQCAIARSLVWIATPASLHDLQRALPQLAPAAYQEAIAALGRLDVAELRPMATEILLTVLSETESLSSECRAAIAHGLGQLNQVRSLSALKGLACDSEERVRWHAISAIERLSAVADC
ncbi:MAG: HEAT repeat domain-containing protein [Cyanobacteria bacterium J06648_11]